MLRLVGWRRMMLLLGCSFIPPQERERVLCIEALLPRKDRNLIEETGSLRATRAPRSASPNGKVRSRTAKWAARRPLRWKYKASTPQTLLLSRARLSPLSSPPSPPPPLVCVHVSLGLDDREHARSVARQNTDRSQSKRH